MGGRRRGGGPGFTNNDSPTPCHFYVVVQVRQEARHKNDMCVWRGPSPCRLRGPRTWGSDQRFPFLPTLSSRQCVSLHVPVKTSWIPRRVLQQTDNGKEKNLQMDILWFSLTFITTFHVNSLVDLLMPLSKEIPFIRESTRRTCLSMKTWRRQILGRWSSVIRECSECSEGCQTRRTRSRTREGIGRNVIRIRCFDWW